MLRKWLNRNKADQEELTKPLVTDSFGRQPGPNGTWETAEERKRRWYD